MGALPHYNCKGLVTSDRQRKLTYFYYQSVLRHDSVGVQAADTLTKMLQMPEPQSLPLRVNMGSRCFFTDDSAHVWQPEQAYTQGSWGYVGGEAFTKKTKYGQLPAADVDILGTDQDPLYQTARVGVEMFRADVPAGQYRVVLHFAELESREKEQMSVYNLGNEVIDTDFRGREMVVRVQDLPGDTINLTRQYGRYRAVELHYTVEAQDGIVIRFESLKGETLLNGIEIMN